MGVIECDVPLWSYSPPLDASLICGKSERGYRHLIDTLNGFPIMKASIVMGKEGAMLAHSIKIHRR